MKVNITGVGVFDLNQNSPLKTILPEIKKNLNNQKLPVAFLKDNDEIIDWHTPIKTDCVLKPLYPEDKKTLEILRHTASHILAQAVKELFPEAKLGIGPATEEGFYYDIWHPTPFKEEDLAKIEKKMKEIIKQNLSLERKDIPKDEAIQLFKNLKEDFKIELIEELEENTVSIYTQGNFVDLCKGPHLLSTGNTFFLNPF